MKLQRNINTASVLGIIAETPQHRAAPDGTPITSFKVCTVRHFVNAAGERKEEVEFHNITAWDKLAEICVKVLQKGTKTFVTGRLKTIKTHDSEGKDRYFTEIVALDVIVVARPDEVKKDENEVEKMME